MSKFLHSLLQVAGFVIQIANVATGVVPAKYQPLVAGIVAALQAGVALVNHKTS